MKVSAKVEDRCAYCGHKESTHMAKRMGDKVYIVCGACRVGGLLVRCYCFTDERAGRDAMNRIGRAPRKLAKAAMEV